MTSSRVWRRKRVYLAWFVLHFFLLFTVSARETLWLVARGLTILPSICNVYAEKLERVGAAVLALHSVKSNRLRRGLVTYLSLAGSMRIMVISLPMSRTAINLPSNCITLTGTRKFKCPARRVVRSFAPCQLAGSNWPRAIRCIPGIHDQELAAVVWRQHRNAATMRASFSQTAQPSLEDYQHGKKETDEAVLNHTISVLLRI